MAASFPGSVKSFTTKADNVDDVVAAHVNDLQLEVSAIETALGINYPVSHTLVSDTSTADETTTSTSYADTTLSLTFTPSKAGVMHISVSIPVNSPNYVAAFAIVIDTVVKMERFTKNEPGGASINMSYSCPVSAAAHTVKIQFKTAGGTLSLYGSTSGTAYLFVTYPT